MYQDPDITIVYKNVVKKDTCKMILSRFIAAEMTEAETGLGRGEVAIAKDPEENYRLKYTDHFGRICYNLSPENPDFEYVMEKIDEYLPKTTDFTRVTFCQIIQYPEGSWMNFHRDEAVETDTGTCLLFLNDNFRGGRLILDGDIFTPSTGTLVSFNNNTQRFHGVEPVLDGDRFVVAVWFDPGDIDEFNELHPENEEPMKATKTFNAVSINV
jgi:hypothetical protein